MLTLPFCRLARLNDSIVISCEMKLNMDYMVEKIWEYLALIRIYTKKPGNAPDLGCIHKLHHKQEILSFGYRNSTKVYTFMLFFLSDSLTISKLYAFY